MVAVKAGEVERVLARASAPLFLVYGPDAGLVAERARTLAERAVDDPADPFQLVRLDGEVVAADPARLADEAGTVGLFGGRRAIWVRPTSRNLAPAVELALAQPAGGSVIIVEAGDLARTSPLRLAVEQSPAALALPCYADDSRDLGALVDEVVRAAGLSIGRQARAALIDCLGADRLASRAEIDKIALYAHGCGEITLADVDAVTSDVSALAVEDLVDAAFAGDLAVVEEASRRLAQQGLAAAVPLGAALRHGLALLTARQESDAGKPAEAAFAAAFRGLHFRRKPRVAAQLRLWTAAALVTRVARLSEAVLETRRVPALAAALAERALLQTATAAVPPSSRRGIA